MNYLVCFLSLYTILAAQSFDSVINRINQSPLDQRQRIIEQYLNTKQFSPIIEQDTILHFVLYGKATNVSVLGALQHWNQPIALEKIPCGPYDFFHITFSVPSDARLDYQLIVDGRYITDPQNPRITPSGFGPHSEARMPRFFSSPYLYYRRDIPHGSIDSLAPVMKYPLPLSHFLIEPRPIKVYKPAGYDTISHLPSVYVLDGFEGIDNAFLPVIIDNLIAEKRIPPIIAVFIPPVDRYGEQMGYKSDRFSRYLCEDLVPMIDHIYRTEPAAQERALMGISSGGFCALSTLLKHQDVFLNAGGQSSSITPGLVRLTEQQMQLNAISPHLKIYLDCGRFDINNDDLWSDHASFLEKHRMYSNLLSSFHIPHYYKEVNDGHDWANWRERMPEMLMYFFGNRP